MTEILFSQDELQEKTGLPPAGFRRDDELAKRKDQLEEMAETQFQNIEAIDPSKLEMDREIQHDLRRGFLELDIGDENVLLWVNFRSQDGIAVWQAKAQGWRIVTPEMVKGIDRDMVREDNTLRVGDVVAMYMRKDKFIVFDQQRENARRRQQFGVEAELNDLAAKNPKALKVVDASPYLGKLQSQAARQTALKALTPHMKKGTVPGLAVPGKR